MANFFDQFDEQPQAQSQPPANFFDQFDEQPVQQQQPVSPYAQGMADTNATLAQSREADTTAAKGFRERAVDAITGSSQMTPELEGLQNVGAAPELNEWSMNALKAGIGQLFGSDASQMKILQSMGGQLSQDSKGNVVVSLPSGDYALNKPGLSPQDITSFLANALAFTPAGRGASILAATGKSVATDVALQGAVQAAGGEQVNPMQTVLSAGIGGAGKAAERGISAVARATRGEIAPEQQSILDFAKKNNVPLLTTDVVKPSTFIGSSAQALGEKIPFTGTGSVRRSQQQARSDLVQRYFEQFSTPSPDEIFQSLQRQTSKVKQAAGQRMTQINDSMQSVGQIKPTQAIDAIDSEITRLSRLGDAADTQTINKLKTYRNELDKGADFGLLRDLRTQFRQDVKGDRVMWPNQSQAAVNRVYSALSGDVNKAVADNLGPLAASKYKQANAAYAHEAQLVNNTRLKNILQKGELTPEVVNNLLFSNKPSEVRQLYLSLDSRGRNAARASVIGKAYEKSQGSPDKFLNEINRLSSQTGILFKGPDRQYLKGLTTYLDKTRRASSAGAVTQTGQELFQIAIPAGIAGDVLKNSGAGTASVLSYGVLARAYESRPVRNAMLRLANTPRGSAAYEKNIEAVSRVLSVSAQSENR
jgi:hypothetical protein